MGVSANQSALPQTVAAAIGISKRLISGVCIISGDVKQTNNGGHDSSGGRASLYIAWRDDSGRL